MAHDIELNRTGEKKKVLPPKRISGWEATGTKHKMAVALRREQHEQHEHHFSSRSKTAVPVRRMNGLRWFPSQFIAMEHYHADCNICHSVSDPFCSSSVYTLSASGTRIYCHFGRTFCTANNNQYRPGGVAGGNGPPKGRVLRHGLGSIERFLRRCTLSPVSLALLGEGNCVSIAFEQLAC